MGPTMVCPLERSWFLWGSQGRLPCRAGACLRFCPCPLSLSCKQPLLFRRMLAGSAPPRRTRGSCYLTVACVGTLPSLGTISSPLSASFHMPFEGGLPLTCRTELEPPLRSKGCAEGEANSNAISNQAPVWK